LSDPWAYRLGVMTNIRSKGTASAQQLELGLGETQPRLAQPPPLGRMARAHWWFAEMHRVVDAALDWQPLPPAPPEQRHMDFTAARP